MAGLALVLVLTSCSGGADDGAAPTPTGAESQQGSVAPSAASSPSATASSGEYVPPSAEGPAQNVPKPVKPALADEPSYEGAQAFLDYAAETRDYAWETGDTSLARETIALEACKGCEEVYDKIDKLYDDGGWASSCRERVVILDKHMPDGSLGIPAPRVHITYGPTKVWDRDGRLIQELPASPRDGYDVWLHMGYRKDGKWEHVMTSHDSR